MNTLSTLAAVVLVSVGVSACTAPLHAWHQKRVTDQIQMMSGQGGVRNTNTVRVSPRDACVNDYLAKLGIHRGVATQRQLDAANDDCRKKEN